MFTDLVLFDKKSEVFNKLNIKDFIRINFSKRDQLFALEGNLKLNRRFLSDRNLDVLVSPEKGITKDFFHYRNSGLNHVLCNLAKKNKIAIGFSFNEILNSSGIERSMILGRMMQNVKLCRKYKVSMVIASFARNEFELRSLDSLKAFGSCIGMNPGEIEKALNLVEDILKKHKFY